MFKSSFVHAFIILLVLQAKSFCQVEISVGVNNDKVVESQNRAFENSLQGKWICVDFSVTLEGELLSNLPKTDYGGELVFNFDGDELFFLQEGNTNFSGVFSIDASQTPMRIKISDRAKGVFRLDGDTLTIRCSDTRPEGFDFGDGLTTEIITLNRVTVEKDGEIIDEANRQTIDTLRGTWELIRVLDGKSGDEKRNIKPLSLKISNDASAWRRGKTRNEISVKVDDTKSPMWIDFSDSCPFYNREDFGVDVPPLPMKGIFRVDADELTLCVSVGGERPMAFDFLSGGIPPLVFKKVR